MAITGVDSVPNIEYVVDKRCISCINSSTSLKLWPMIGITNFPIRKNKLVVNCSLSNALSPLESKEDVNLSGSDSAEDDFSHVTKFKMSDFKIRNRVSIGLGGKGDEMVFEAMVNDPQSPLYKTRVVLKQLISAQAKRRGRRAIEVLKRLARRKLMYHSYSMQVHGYICSSMIDEKSSFTLVHGHHGSASLRHWLQRSDWLPTLEATLSLDQESVRRVGDNTIGGPAISRQLRLIRILMRDLLIGVNYVHSHGLAHTELRLENLHISAVDKHIKVGILGNAADFNEADPADNIAYDNMDRRRMMIAFDMRCVGFIMAKMVLRELMDPKIFANFKAFLTKILDRNWGAGWHLLSVLLAPKPSDRISCLNALRHPFLCGPKWRVNPSIDLIRWSLGSTTVRIAEEYIYGQQQRSRLAHFVELMEMLNPYPKPKHWLGLLPGKWRLLYCTGRHIGLTLRQPPVRVLIGEAYLTISKVSKPSTIFSAASHISFTVMGDRDWAHDKSGVEGKLLVNSSFRLRAGRRLYLKEETITSKFPSATPDAQASILTRLSSKKWRKAIPIKEFPSSLSVAKLVSDEIDVMMSLHEPLSGNAEVAQKALQEVRTQIPPEMFDLSKIVCGTYLDSRLLLLRSVNGSALFFHRCTNDC
ncbi:probable plastid-lipid-associated protein 14, chloroplastic isoform X2 [Capsicum annuum]|uniref:probable plastid-lipid-associated protein 14, chloroplastic isoform X2 n=1 Tax=Capsicum annuum TaxID=4072 RepID=UPI001FB0FC67|nr:probable plastid-lipid-associated protein 14, chloroplastic isoform X2 [Capsicum annuum]